MYLSFYSQISWISQSQKCAFIFDNYMSLLSILTDCNSILQEKSFESRRKNGCLITGRHCDQLGQLVQSLVSNRARHSMSHTVLEQQVKVQSPSVPNYTFFKYWFVSVEHFRKVFIKPRFSLIQQRMEDFQDTMNNLCLNKKLTKTRGLHHQGRKGIVSLYLILEEVSYVDVCPALYSYIHAAMLSVLCPHQQ